MRYYCIKQHDITDCGAACLATIAKQNGYKIPISKIREIAGTDKQGTNASGMIKAAEQLGFSAKAVKGDQTRKAVGVSVDRSADISREVGKLCKRR